ncbi:hypothetical protein ANCDUO_17396 [Ancylostoma duodenale]|uniref:Uncharacterized protein n=1 Tax=Ancylostoma duodenale TaxID=51022 RepID=A0A0C2C858_9BILA|nr:hypothetical protein ANCDUO_17396 [Ancylostoma duodenale]
MVTATKDWNHVQINSYNQIGDHYNYFKCTHWIKSPNGTKIEIEISDISSNVERIGCILAGIEIKTQEDQRLTGYSQPPAEGPAVMPLKSWKQLFRNQGSLTQLIKDQFPKQRKKAIESK